jgi:hypothetical protein
MADRPTIENITQTRTAESRKAYNLTLFWPIIFAKNYTPNFQLACRCFDAKITYPLPNESNGIKSRTLYHTWILTAPPPK